MLTIQIEQNDDGDGYKVSVLDMRDGGGSWEEPIENLSDDEARKLADNLITAMNESLK